MKFGVIAYRRPVRPGSGVNINIGDSIQQLAVLNLYEQMGIPRKDIIFIDRYHMGSYDGEYVVLPMCCFNMISNMYHYQYDSLPPSAHILPVYFSFHLHSRRLSAGLIDHFRRNEPIGCRDEETMRNLRQAGVMAYLSGCVTATFPRRSDAIKGTKNFFVDVSEELKKYIPPQLGDSAEFIRHMPPYRRRSDGLYLSDEEMHEILFQAKQLLIKYNNEARLMVSARLHAASPSMAMGIPTIIAKDNVDGRFAWIDKLLPVYSRGQYSAIDWNPAAASYEQEKSKMIELFRSLILDKYNHHSAQYDLSSFFEKRKPADYNSLLQKKLGDILDPSGERQKYAVWGISPTSEHVVNLISQSNADAELVAGIDKFIEGSFYGAKIFKPQEITELPPDILYIITAGAARSEAVELLNRLSRRYIII